MKQENLLNKKFERLLVIEKADSINKRSAWKCLCDCGNIKIIKSENLKNGSTKSCGCLNNEQRKNNSKKMHKALIKYLPAETSARSVWRKRYKDGISFEDFYQLSQLPCFYCGCPPNNVSNSAKNDKKSSEYAKNNGYFIYNGLDRIDNFKSHTKENCVPCCKWCNYSKRERSFEDFKSWIKLVYNKICTEENKNE